MKITKRQLRRLIKEEVAHVLFEADQGDLWSWLDTEGLEANNHDPGQELAGAMAQAIAGGVNEDDLKKYVVMKLKPIVDEPVNELDPDVKEAGGPKGYRKLKFEALASAIKANLAKKPSGSKSQAGDTGGGLKHIQRVKKGLGKK